MLKEFSPAVEWLEKGYDTRDEITDGWRSKLDPTEFHSTIPLGLDLNTYRRDFYQILGVPTCGDYLRNLCEEDGERCTHPEHDDYVDCYCFGGTPAFIHGPEWTAEDDHKWLKFGSYRGGSDRYMEYLKTVHAYMWVPNFDDKPNNTDWWIDE